MRFVKGKPVQSSEQDRNFVGSENYRLDFEETGAARCPACHSRAVERRPNYAIDDTGHLRVGLRCLSCVKQWQEIYVLCGCDQVPHVPPDLDWFRERSEA